MSQLSVSDTKCEKYMANLHVQQTDGWTDEWMEDSIINRIIMPIDMGIIILHAIHKMEIQKMTSTDVYFD